MEQIQQIPQSADDTETTLSAPRFDEEAAETAQPVVPLASVSHNDIVSTVAPLQVASSPMSRSWLLAWIFVSALIGSGLGILALSLYQQHQKTATPNVQLQSDPTIKPSIISQTAAQPSPSIAPTLATEAVTPAPGQEPSQLSKGAPSDPRSDTHGQREVRSNAPPTQHNSPIESESHERKSQEKERRKAQEKNGYSEERDEPRPRRADSSTASRRTNQPSMKPDRTERIDRPREISGDAQTRRAPPRSSEPQSRNIGRIREIFEGAQKP